MADDRKNEIFGGPPASAVEAMGAGGDLFKLSVIDVPLPSDGLVYPKDHPLSGVSSIAINGMTAAQENILTNKALAKRGTLLTALIQSCLRDKAINAREMLIGDRNTIMVSLRITGYGPDYRIKVSCPSCSETSVQGFDLQELPIRRLAITPVEAGTNLFDFVLPQTKARVRFRFLTGGDEEEIAVVQSQRKKAGLGFEGEMVTSGLLQAIVSINGISDRSQISMALPRMPAFDSQALRRYIQDNEPGMQLKGTMSCPDCGFTGEVDMPLGASFFWPGAE